MPESRFRSTPNRLLAGVLLALSSTAFAETIYVPDRVESRPVEASAWERTLVNLVENVGQGSLSYVRHFPGPDGMTGVVARLTENPDQPVIAWVPPGGRYLIIGTLLDGQGFNANTHIASRESLAGVPVEAAPTPVPQAHDHPPRTELPESMEKTLESLDIERLLPELFEAMTTREGIGIDFGADAGAPSLVVFFDPLCGYCVRLHEMLETPQVKALIEERGIRIRYLPVASEHTLGLSAALVEKADEGLDALRVRDGRIGDGSESDDPASRAVVEANTRLMINLFKPFGPPATPSLAWRDRDGQIHRDAGMPDMNTLIERLKALPGVGANETAQEDAP